MKIIKDRHSARELSQEFNAYLRKHNCAKSENARCIVQKAVQNGELSIEHLIAVGMCSVIGPMTEGGPAETFTSIAKSMEKYFEAVRKGEIAPLTTEAAA